MKTLILAKQTERERDFYKEQYEKEQARADKLAEALSDANATREMSREASAASPQGLTPEAFEAFLKRQTTKPRDRILARARADRAKELPSAFVSPQDGDPLGIASHIPAAPSTAIN